MDMPSIIAGGLQLAEMAALALSLWFLVMAFAMEPAKGGRIQHVRMARWCCLAALAGAVPGRLITDERQWPLADFVSLGLVGAIAFVAILCVISLLTNRPSLVRGD
jgi:hypothetical protein